MDLNWIVKYILGNICILDSCWLQETAIVEVYQRPFQFRTNFDDKYYGGATRNWPSSSWTSPKFKVLKFITQWIIEKSDSITDFRWDIGQSKKEFRKPLRSVDKALLQTHEVKLADQLDALNLCPSLWRIVIIADYTVPLVLSGLGTLDWPGLMQPLLIPSHYPCSRWAVLQLQHSREAFHEWKILLWIRIECPMNHASVHTSQTLSMSISMQKFNVSN